MRRPKIKYRRRPVRLGVGEVLLGGGVAGANARFSDPDGWAWTLFELLDGTRSAAEVVTHMAALRPDRPAALIQKVIDELTEHGFIDDGDEVVPAEFTESEIQRYSRNRELFSWMDCVPRTTSWDVQLLLRQAKVVVIGLGGVGGRAAMDLVASGVGEVHCVDRDFVSLTDLNRQFLYTERDLNDPKVDAAVRRLREVNSDVRVTGEFMSIDEPDDLRRFATTFDVVLIAADRPHEIRRWANRACLSTGTRWVHGGYHGPLMSIGVHEPGKGPCHECLNLELAREADLPVLTPWSPGVDVTAPQAATASTAGFTGGFAAVAVMSLLTGIPAMPTNCRYEANLFVPFTTEVFTTEVPDPSCPSCRGRS